MEDNQELAGDISSDDTIIQQTEENAVHYSLSILGDENFGDRDVASNNTDQIIIPSSENARAEYPIK